MNLDFILPSGSENTALFMSPYTNGYNNFIGQKIDFLQVELNNNAVENNKNLAGFFGSETPNADFTNLPTTWSGSFYGYKEIVVMGTSIHKEPWLYLVRLHEFYPLPGRIWYNLYNKDFSNWSGWYEIRPEKRTS